MYEMSEISEYIIKNNIRKSKCVEDLFRLGKRKQIATDKLLIIHTDIESMILLLLNHLNAMNPLSKPHNVNITI